MQSTNSWSVNPGQLADQTGRATDLHCYIAYNTATG